MLPVIDRQSPKQVVVGCQDAEEGSTREFYSDGTLGKHSKFANLAHGGWGWVVLDENCEPTCGRYGLLEGEFQKSGCL